MSQIEMVSSEDLVSVNHSYRKFCVSWNFSFASKRLKRLEKSNPYRIWDIAIIQVLAIAVYGRFKWQEADALSARE